MDGGRGFLESTEVVVGGGLVGSGRVQGSIYAMTGARLCMWRNEEHSAGITTKRSLLL